MRRTTARRASASPIEDFPNDQVSPLFEAVAEATEEAVLNSLFKAETTSGNGVTIEALPLEPILHAWRERQRSR